MEFFVCSGNLPRLKTNLNVSVNSHMVSGGRGGGGLTWGVRRSMAVIM